MRIETKELQGIWAGDAAPDGGDDLEVIRGRIDELDGELVALIARRCRLVSAAGAHKRRAALAVVDPPQEAAVVRRGAERARAEGIAEEEVVRHIFWCLIDLARRVQTEPPAGRPGPERRL